MKTKEELNALKEEVETGNQKLRALTKEELEQVTGGASILLDDEVLMPQKSQVQKSQGRVQQHGQKSQGRVITAIGDGF